MFMTANQQPLHLILEELPDCALKLILLFLANNDRAALIQLARASPRLYAPAIAMAIRTAPAFWPLVSTDPATGRPQAYFGHSTSHAMSLGMGVDGDAITHGWKYGPPAGFVRGIYLIPTVFDWNKRTDPTHVAELNQQITNRPIGPIPFHQLRSLYLAGATLDLISPMLPHAQRVLLGCLDDLDVLEAILDEIDALGGLPETLATAETHFADKMLAASGADVPIRRLARLLTNSRVRDLSLSFDISIYSREWNKPFVLSASQWLMNHGLPPSLTTLRLDGLWGPHLDGSDMITPYTVGWPVSLRHFHLKVSKAYGNESVVVTQLLTSLAVAKVPNLVTLDVTGANFDQRDVTGAIVGALSATLTTLRLVQYYPRRPDPEDARHLCAVFQAIASKCPRLQSLHVEPKILFERNELTVLARDAIPELCGLANLNTLALVAWDLTAEVDSFWAALADAVPNLLVLDLSRNQIIDDGIVDQLMPLVQHGHLRRLVMTGNTKLSLDSQKILASMIHQAQRARRAAAVQ
ncbi:hypothetical protein AMAG_16549 [Allomyces macrogynus ATCC 38327]|uniref:F-box domain-containing protein n=1 Tax=Allomyces macrogynus (strain ATCC 38327) TaxID=578462 RepID=A0A0L0TCV4_ALLM3|nr:hypothetical protein AMAG_16549 [Allomyces macrogynus ATCC 38327]|eukprot:KNE72506.1 hypothetical protein AMAG_16549 [Allomyces macrogynus ATCC 38327]